jgi:hypothetical protein
MKAKLCGAAAILLALSASAALAQDDNGGWRGGHGGQGGQGQGAHAPPPGGGPHQPPAPPQPASPPAPPQAPSGLHTPWTGYRGPGLRPGPGGPPPQGWRHEDHGGGPGGAPNAQPQPQLQQQGPGGRGDWRDRDHRPPSSGPGAPQAGWRGPQTWDRGPGDRWRQEDGRPGPDHRPSGGAPDAPQAWRRGEHPWAPHRYPPIYRSPERFRAWAWVPPPGWSYRPWRYGEYLPRAWLIPDYFIEDWWDFGLPEAPPGYEWIRLGADALLIDDHGQVVQVVRDVFW